MSVEKIGKLVHQSKKTFGFKLWALTSGFLAVLLIFGVTSMVNLGKISKHLWISSQVELPSVRNMTLVDMMHDGLRANVFSALLAAGDGKADEFKEIKKENQEFSENINRYLGEIEALPIDPEIRAVIEPAKGPVKEYTDSASEIVNLAASGKLELARARMPKFLKSFDELEDKLGALGEAIEKHSEEAAMTAETASQKSSFLSLVFLAFSFLVAFAAAWAIIKNLKQSLGAVITGLGAESINLSKGAHQLRDSATSLSSSTEQQVSAIGETAAALDEINSMTQKTQAGSKDLTESAQTSLHAGEEGKQAVDEMLSAMDRISESTARMFQQIELGNQKISEIVQVIGAISNKTAMINEIVFQTKLLSFNASVEAARAGEHGKGFAVVAEEVGNLAQMSGNVAREIGEIVDGGIKKVQGIVSENQTQVKEMSESTMDKVKEGSKVAQTCRDSLNKIVEQANHVSQIATDISVAIDEQTLGLKEISTALQSLNQSTASNSGSAGHTSQLSEDLLKRSSNLESVVAELSEMTFSDSTAVIQKAA